MKIVFFTPDRRHAPRSREISAHGPPLNLFQRKVPPYFLTYLGFWSRNSAVINYANFSKQAVDEPHTFCSLGTGARYASGVMHVHARVCNARQILYEDDEIIAVSKPAGMVVHPAPGSWNGTFVNALIFHLENSGAEGKGGAVVVGGGVADAGFRPSMPDGEHNPSMRPGIVHRLDKGTTGVLLAAKNPTMQAKLAELFAQRKVSRRCCCSFGVVVVARQLVG